MKNSSISTAGVQASTSTPNHQTLAIAAPRSSPMAREDHTSQRLQAARGQGSNPGPRTPATPRSLPRNDQTPQRRSTTRRTQIPPSNSSSRTRSAPRSPAADNRQPSRRSPTTGHQEPIPSTGPQTRATPRYVQTDDPATKQQMNQTLAVTMMTCPVNPVPFPLPIPLGLTMLLAPQGKGSGLPPRR
ncbi:hypothetical protein VTI74DRAFT_10594 [Chaetomium olivicolor]